MGFNGSNVTDLGSWENLVELLARGLKSGRITRLKRDFGRICLKGAKGLLGNIHYGAAFKYGKDVRCEEKSGSGTVEKARKVIGDTVLGRRLHGEQANSCNARVKWVFPSEKPSESLSARDKNSPNSF